MKRALFNCRTIRLALRIPLLAVAILFLSPTALVQNLESTSAPSTLQRRLPPEVRKSAPALPAKPGVSPASRAELAKKINAILSRSLYRRAAWGIDIYSVDDEVTLYSRNKYDYFAPASNAKLFTTATALTRLGSEFRFQTFVSYEGTLNAEGRLSGNLVISGRGDPNLANSILDESDPFCYVDAMVEKVKLFGIKVVDGNIIGDDSYFEYAPFGQGWTREDENSYYGAPVSALSFFNNRINVSARPAAKVGEPASVYTYPVQSMFQVVNHSRTVRRHGGQSRFALYQAQGSNLISASGDILLRSKGHARQFAVHDPAFYTATVFRERLRHAGIKVLGKPVARHSGEDKPASRTALYAHHSLPLLDIVSYVNKQSQNLYAEILLRTLGAEIEGAGTDKAGIRVVNKFLADAGVRPGAVRLCDGSGLSRDGLVTPYAETELLKYMARQPRFQDFLSTLPISGVDGTLKGRMRTGPAAGRVFAKTGTLDNVATLGGYVRTRSGRLLAFSVLGNELHCGPYSARRALDRICQVLAAY